MPWAIFAGFSPAMTRPVSADMPEHQRPVIIAHRGESHDAPENTLSSINLAWERGARAVEVDVRISADGQLMVIHDRGTARIGGPNLPVSRQTAAQLRALDAGAWKDVRWAGERIPLLGEVLATIPARGRLFVELKEGPEMVPVLAKLVADMTMRPERLLLMSFEPSTVASCSRRFPEIECSQLLNARDWTDPVRFPRLISAAVDRGCRSLNIEGHRKLGARLIESIHAAGLRAYAWTINQPARARQLRNSGIDAIATDRCEWMTKHLDAMPHHRDCGS